MSGAAHLVKRFAGSLRPGGPRSVDVAWVATVLSSDELALWRRMYGPDRRHSVQVARDVEADLGVEATHPVLAAALLHDVGKVQSGLRTYTRVMATLVAAVAGRDMAPAWAQSSGITRRIGLYLMHDEIGADLLAMAGSDPLAIAWAREHHLPAEQWTVDPRIARAIDHADND